MEVRRSASSRNHTPMRETDHSRRNEVDRLTYRR